jgi:hypothetical protein
MCRYFRKDFKEQNSGEQDVPEEVLSHRNLVVIEGIAYLYLHQFMNIGFFQYILQASQCECPCAYLWIDVYYLSSKAFKASRASCN